MSADEPEVMCRYCGLPSPDEAEICVICFEDRQRYGFIKEDGTWAQDVVLYEVGGSVRDGFLGIDSKDKDFAVEAPSWERMKEFLEWRGFTIFVETPEFLTIRAHFPKEHPDYGKTTADFVLCRKEGAYSDGRHPDTVEVGTIYDDLARRDFTVNAMARRLGSSVVLDPWNGKEHLDYRRLIAVGDTETRLREDPLRALRALRFMVCKNFTLSGDIRRVVYADWFAPLLASVSTERKREELTKMFKHNTRLSMLQFAGVDAKPLRDAVFCDGLWLKPTLEQ